MALIGYILGTLAVVCGVAVVAFRNPLYSALALVANMLFIAGMYASMEAHFIAIAQIVLYAGAIMVLVLFVIMLLNIKKESIRRISPLSVGISIAVGVLFLSTVIPVILANVATIPEARRSDALLFSVGDTKSIGKALFTDYAVPFEITSALLMVGVVGAIMMAKRVKPKV